MGNAPYPVRPDRLWYSENRGIAGTTSYFGDEVYVPRVTHVPREDYEDLIERVRAIGRTCDTLVPSSVIRAMVDGIVNDESEWEKRIGG